MNDKLFGIPIPQESKSQVLENILKYILKPEGFVHIVSLNPENMVTATKNADFHSCLAQAQIRIIDGVGVGIASRLLGIKVGQRVTGVDLMTDMLKMAHKSSLRVMLIGGNEKIAEQVADCQKKLFPGMSIKALMGIADISSPQKNEEEHIFSIVADYKPHILFASFGSPFQELWLYSHKDRLDSIIAMGVGGAFDFMGGRVPRAPRIVQNLGFEWLFRLILQPWRVVRQLRLIEFMWLVGKKAIHVAE